MAPKQTRVVAAKTKELQSVETPLMRTLRNIKNAKVQETSCTKTWAKIKEWAYQDKKITSKAEKISHGTIISYMNTPFMASFCGTKETVVKFIINWYHNGKFYFEKLVEIFGKIIYKLIEHSNQGEPVPIDLNITHSTYKYRVRKRSFTVF